MIVVLAAGWGALWFGPDLAAMPLAGACSIALTAGLVLASAVVGRQPARRPAAVLLAVSGWLWPLNTLAGWQVGAFPIIRQFGECVFWVVLAAAVFLYQDPRLARPERLYLIASGVQFILGQMIWVGVSRPEWGGFPAEAWWPTVIENRALFDATSLVLALLYVPNALVFSALVALRQKRGVALDRYSLTPVVAAIAAAALAAGISWASYGRTTLAVPVVLLPLPAAFVYSATRLSRIRVQLGEALAALPGGSDGAAVTAALRSVLRDASLRMTFWSSERREWVDEAGRLAAPLPTSTGRLEIPVLRRDGRLTAHVSTVATSPSARRQVEAAVRLSATAIENAGLRALVRAQVEAVGRAHARTVQAGLDERRRLEQDLHDGAQQRLLGVLAILSLARHETVDTPAQPVVRDAEAEVRRALCELRDLARGLHPSVLTREGLSPALREAASRLALPIEVTTSVHRLTPVVESAIYFVACEAITNVAKHACADRAWLTVREVEDGVELDVCDDGIGGADTEGHGVRGMADRVIALGGRLTVLSEPGLGTSIRVWVPCA
ncbi:sensor histidine kinase [Actinomycetospora sp. CA-053990]|uniref:sensor histidine kinase n=1 Tax=Actinomycetospora sp. CA-053990 TaxID=3239891 RepID=UPI003D8DB6C9